ASGAKRRTAPPGVALPRALARRIGPAPHSVLGARRLHLARDLLFEGGALLDDVLAVTLGIDECGCALARGGGAFLLKPEALGVRDQPDVGPQLLEPGGGAAIIVADSGIGGVSCDPVAGVDAHPVGPDHG